MRKICFVTGTRADYGIMAPMMQKLHRTEGIELQIIATNMHLSPQFGMTVNEIIDDGLPVTWRIDSLLSGDSPAATVKTMGLTQIGMADALSHLQPDLIVILGDRYEMLAAASAALIFRIPVAHLYGGETTEGAYDDAIRHAITQLSAYHFTSTEEYANRVISMGAKPENVHWIGSLGADNIRHGEFMTLGELEESIGHDLGDRFIVATFHPVTTTPGEEKQQTEALLTALDRKIAEGWKVLFTMPNSDTGGSIVAETIRQWAAEKPDSVALSTSLGRKRYYSALKHTAAVVGNSSSGLIEAPSFGIPTLDIGNRQKGRARGESVVNVATDTDSISKGLDLILSPDFREKARNCDNPYSRANTLDMLFDHLLEITQVK